MRFIRPYRSTEDIERQRKLIVSGLARRKEKIAARRVNSFDKRGYYTASEVAVKLKVPRFRVVELYEAGELTGVVRGNNAGWLYIERTSVAAYLSKHPLSKRERKPANPVRTTPSKNTYYNKSDVKAVQS